MAVTKYPTKEEILRKELKLEDGLLNALLAWKNIIWVTYKKTNPEKSLILLNEVLNALYSKNIKVFFNPAISTCCYVPKERAIYMNSHSIISLLHEYGHAIYGASELKACRFSVHIFKNLFPRAYAKLEWSGHMLVKHKV
jgi:hypothetical protein